MKKNDSWSINQSKLLENEELVNLRGGYYTYGASTCCYYYSDYNFTLIKCVGVATGAACPEEPAGTVYTSKNTCNTCNSY